MQMRALAIAAGACAAAYLLSRRLRVRCLKAAEASDTSSQATALPSSADRTLPILPESIESANTRPEKSPLRAFAEHAVSRRILTALPLYFGGTALVLGISKGPRLLTFACGLLIGQGFPAMLWPTDQGVRSRSWFLVMSPLSFLRAVLVSRAVYIEAMYNPVLTAVSYLHGGYCLFMTWTLFVLNVRARLWPCPPRCLCSLNGPQRYCLPRAHLSTPPHTPASGLLIGAWQEPLEVYARPLGDPPRTLPRRRGRAALHRPGPPRPLPSTGAGRRPLLRGGRGDAHLLSASGHPRGRTGQSAGAGEVRRALRPYARAGAALSGTAPQ